jgi:hypothetical protein
MTLGYQLLQKGDPMAGRDGAGKKFVPGSRKYDRTIDDALRTMERFAAWLANAKENDVWEEADDALQTAMLHGMLTHLRGEIDDLLALGGQEVQNTAALLRTFAVQTEECSIDVSRQAAPEGSAPPFHASNYTNGK